jgi:hypothetical protein
VSDSEEEGEYEYASYHPHAENGKEEHHLESGVLYQPLQGTITGSNEDEPSEASRALVMGGCPSREAPCWKGRRGYRRPKVREGSPWEPLDGLCLTVGAANPFTGPDCAAYDFVRAATK